MARHHEVLTIRLDAEDVLRLMAYRAVLQEIAQLRWSAEGVVARRVLAHFEDLPPDEHEHPEGEWIR